MTLRHRDKRISHLMKEELGRFFIEEIQGRVPGLITITRVEMSADLMTARVYISVFGGSGKEEILALLEKRKGYIRRILASRINLKYNPELFFALDPAPDDEEKLDRLIETTKKHES